MCSSIKTWDCAGVAAVFGLRAALFQVLVGTKTFTILYFMIVKGSQSAETSF